MCGKPSPEEELRSTPRLPTRALGRIHHTQQQLHGLLHVQCACSVHAMYIQVCVCGVYGDTCWSICTASYSWR